MWSFQTVTDRVTDLATLLKYLTEHPPLHVFQGPDSNCLKQPKCCLKSLNSCHLQMKVGRPIAYRSFTWRKTTRNTEEIKSTNSVISVSKLVILSLTFEMGSLEDKEFPGSWRKILFLFECHKPLKLQITATKDRKTTTTLSNIWACFLCSKSSTTVN